MKPASHPGAPRKVRVLVNPKSGPGSSFDALWGLVEKHWSGDRADVSYQFSHDVADGQRKAALGMVEMPDRQLSR